MGISLSMQVIDIDIKGQSPVGNGTVICASVYCGPDVDFGAGPVLWIDPLHDPATLDVTRSQARWQDEPDTLVDNRHSGSIWRMRQF